MIKFQLKFYEFLISVVNENLWGWGYLNSKVRLLSFCRDFKLLDKIIGCVFQTKIMNATMKKFI